MFSLIIILGRFTRSIAIPIDDLDFNTPLIDSTQSSLFLAENDDLLTTADATLPNSCAVAQDDLSFTQDTQDDLSFTQDPETNLFSRDDRPQCLPPVNIGAEALQLFESPLDSLESTILPLKGETPNDLPPLSIPGRLPDDRPGFLTPKQMEDEGWTPYTGPVRIEVPKNNNCEDLVRHRGNFKIEVCCNAMYVSYEANSESARSIMAGIDAETIANQDIALIFNCICTCCFSPDFHSKRERVFKEDPFKSASRN